MAYMRPAPELLLNYCRSTASTDRIRYYLDSKDFHSYNQPNIYHAQLVLDGTDMRITSHILNTNAAYRPSNKELECGTGHIIL
uniref:Uncharacterized protein n=1 Tax=Picea glauca TaxID=3330 RepID=A0A101M242_PICGL|nr:hypothetical protein ABT39_MTgene1756 [Picea glauca]KUM49631.1 hypothetical protein ABT39_MTgene2856 [Picea glauca]